MATDAALCEAVLFAAGGPVSKKKLGTLLERDDAALDHVLQELQGTLAERGVALIEADGEVELRTAPEAAAAVQRLRESELARDLGRAALETLAIVAYHDGATRSDIEWIRGVYSGASLRTLLMRGLIAAHGDTQDKRRTRYAVTTEALAHLGVRSVQELPAFADLSGRVAEAQQTEPQEPHS